MENSHPNLTAGDFLSSWVVSVWCDAWLCHEPVRRGGGRGGHSAGRGHGERGAAAAHGTPPSVLLPAARAQPLRAADTDGRGEAHPGEGRGCEGGIQVRGVVGVLTP